MAKNKIKLITPAEFTRDFPAEDESENANKALKLINDNIGRGVLVTEFDGRKGLSPLGGPKQAEARLATVRAELEAVGWVVKVEALSSGYRVVLAVG